MIGSVLFAVLVCEAAAYDVEPKYVKIVSVRKKYVEPKYQDTLQSRYPVYIHQGGQIGSYREGDQPYGVDYGMPQETERKDYGEEDGYSRGEVIRSPLIFAVGPKEVYKRNPQQDRKGPARKLLGIGHCTDEQMEPKQGELFYPSEPKLGKEHEQVKEFESRRLKDKFHSDRASLFRTQGSVKHKQLFQTPILIAEEKPGYKYIKHLVGVGELPKERQYQVFIIEGEDTPQHAVTEVKKRQKDLGKKEIPFLYSIIFSKNGVVQEEKDEMQLDERIGKGGTSEVNERIPPKNAEEEGVSTSGADNEGSSSADGSSAAEPVGRGDSKNKTSNGGSAVVEAEVSDFGSPELSTKS